MILHSSATTTKQMLNSKISGVKPLMSVFKPMLAKKMGGKNQIIADVNAALHIGGVMQGCKEQYRQYTRR